MISIWLSPCDADMEFYQQVIIALSKRYDTPVFEPHLTLQPDVSRQFSEENYQHFCNVAKHRMPFELEMKPLETMYRYFQCFYLRSLSGHFELIQLHLLSLDIFKIKETPFMPHMSLLYGDLDKAIIDDLIDEYGDCLDRKVIFDKIKFVETSGDVENWQVLKTLHIGTQQHEKTYRNHMPSIML